MYMLRISSEKTLCTQECLHITRKINDFENLIFGPDFSCKFEDMKPWVLSGDLYIALVPDEKAEYGIASLVSMLITTESCSNELKTGKILERELVPWSTSPDKLCPSMYFSSLILSSKVHYLFLLRSLQRDLQQRSRSSGTTISGAFSISTSPIASKHLERAGFSQFPDHQYLDKYPTFILSKDSARTRFWKYVCTELEI